MASQRTCRIYVATGCAGQVLRPQAAQPLGTHAPAVRRPATLNGCWATCGRRPRCMSSRRSTRTTGALLARNPYNAEFADQHRLLRCRRVTSHAQRRSRRIHRPQRQPERPGGDGRARVCPARVGAALDPCGAIQVPFDMADGQIARARFSASACGRSARMRATWCCACAGPGPRAPRSKASGILESHARAVQVETPDAGARSAGQRLAALSDDRLPARGVAAATTSPEARSAFAISCRMSWRWCMPSRRCCASSCCARRAAIPRRRCAALVASPSRTRRAHALLG